MFNLNNFKTLSFVLIGLCVFLSLSCVCAETNLETTLNSAQDIEGLNHEINNLNPGDEYNFNHDYNMGSSDSSIEIKTSNVTINGNGYSISAYDHTGSVFNVLGDNVVIKDLNIVGANEIAYIHDKDVMSVSSDPYYRDFFNSPICWYGNDGVIDNCTFSDNYGVNGGVISLYGNNDTIQNTLFINSTALGVGAAFYNNGINNTFTNTTFINSRTCLSNEDFFTDKEMIVKNNYNNEGLFLLSNEIGLFYFGIDNNANNTYLGIDNTYVGFDVDNFEHVFPVNFVDTRVNMIPIIYGSITGFYPVDGDIPNASYIGIFGNGTFSLSIDHDIDDVLFSLSYQFNNLTSVNDIIAKLKDYDYVKSLMLTKNVDVFDSESYDAARSITSLSSFSKDMIKACFEIVDKKDANAAYKMSSTNVGKLTSLSKLRELGVAFNYNVWFNGAYNFNSHNTWDIDALGYDVVSISGNGSTIYGSAGDEDEYNWAIIKSSSLLVEDLEIHGFNNAIINYGACVFNNVVFNGNRMDYTVDRDWGAAIQNAGICVCNNCSFIDSYASKGGAIFTQGQISLNNCTFSGNMAYKLGNDILNADKGDIFVNGAKISLNNEETNGVVTYAESMSLTAISGASMIVAVASCVLGGILLCVPGANAVTALLLPFVGAAIGGGIGLIGSQIVARGSVYDMNFDLEGYTLGLVMQCAGLGFTSFVIGSAIGQYVNGKMMPKNTDMKKVASDIKDNDPIDNPEQNNMINQEQINQNVIDNNQNIIDNRPSNNDFIRLSKQSSVRGYDLYRNTFAGDGVQRTRLTNVVISNGHVVD